MKNIRKNRKLSLLLVAMLVFGLLSAAASAEANDVNVCSYEELAEAFNDTAAEVRIVLGADISFADKDPISANADRIYTITGNGFALIDAAFAGSGKVIIEADCTATEESSGPALAAREQVSIEMKGNISAEGEGRNGAQLHDSAHLLLNGNVASLNGVGVCAYDDAKVEIYGNVTGGISAADNPDVGISANGRAEFIIEGEVSSLNGDAVKGYDDSVIQIVGKVSAASADGIETAGNARVEVTGDVYGGEGGEGIEADENSQVKINGNVYGGIGRAPDAEGNLEHGNYYASDGYSDGGHAIQAKGNSYVYVTGNATGGMAYGTAAIAGDGVYARDQSEVHVEGNAIGGVQTADPNVAGDISTYGLSGSGAHAESTATIHVYSDAIGADTNAQLSKSCPGILITLVVKDGVKEAGTVIVDGSCIGGKATAKDGLDCEAIFYSYMYYDENERHYSIDEFIVPAIEVGSLAVTGNAEMLGTNAEGLIELVQDNELVRITK